MVKKSELRRQWRAWANSAVSAVVSGAAITLGTIGADVAVSVAEGEGVVATISLKAYLLGALVGAGVALWRHVQTSPIPAIFADEDDLA